jgi:hypothetical protein
MDALTAIDIPAGLAHPTRFTLITRKQVEVNTDPQRRCYNGCHFSSEMVWTQWVDLGNPATEEEGNESIACFASINPRSEYRLLPPSAITQPRR